MSLEFAKISKNPIENSFNSYVMNKRSTLRQLFFGIGYRIDKTGTTTSWDPDGVDVEGLMSYDATKKFDNANLMFSNCSLKSVPKFDTSNMTHATQMFKTCMFTDSFDVSFISFENFVSTNAMFSNCNTPDMENFELNLSKSTDVGNLFAGSTSGVSLCFGAKNITLTIGATNKMGYVLYNNNRVEKMVINYNYSGDTTTVIDNICNNATNLKEFIINKQHEDYKHYIGSTASAFNNCKNLTVLKLFNIGNSLAIGSGTSWGHLLTVESLVNTCKECINRNSSRTLTMGSANTEKLADVYVRLTDEPEENTQYPKLPMEVCESTDEGAMLITDYMALKNWVIQ